VGTLVERDDGLILSLSGKTLSKLCELIDEHGWGYRSGAKLVAFFNDLGYSHEYPDNVDFWERFPSRADYTAKMLKEINGTPKLKDCIKNAFAVEDFVERLPELDELISTFNLYLALDDWRIARANTRIVFYTLREQLSETASTAVPKPDTNYYNLIVTMYAGKTAPEQVAYYGFVTDIKVLQTGYVKLKFRCLAEIPQQAINGIAHLLDIFGGNGITELNHTHWTIKNIDLIEELTDAGLLPENGNASPQHTANGGY
jgi:hypothetical protein